MTRINTNVSSLVAQNTLNRSNAALNQALTRLSTGLRINTGKDDPAGLIASENLRSDISSIKRAIGNTDRANQVIATADSALGQVSSLLNDIRGLVTESANTGALSAEQIEANQLQIDSSLEALNRIAQTTTFQGRRLLDGSLDFITTAGTGFSTVSDLKIDQANLGATGQMAVSVDIRTAAARALITNSAIPAGSGSGVQASTTLTFTDAAASATGNVSISVAEQQASGTVTLDTANDASFTLTAVTGDDAAGAAGNAFTSLVIVDGAVEGATYDSNTGVLSVTVDITGGNNAVTDLVSVITNSGLFAVSNVTDGTDTIADTNTGAGTLTGGQDAETAAIAITADPGAEGNDFEFVIEEVNGIGATPNVSQNGNVYTIQIDDTVATSIADIAAAIAGITGIASATTTSTASYNPADDSEPVNSTTLTGGSAAASDVITVTADAAGTTPNGLTVTIVEANAHGAPTAAFDGSGNIVVTVDDAAATTIAQIASAIDGLAGYSASVTTNAGDGDYVNGTDNAVDGTLAGGAAGGGLDAAVVLEVGGETGGEVLTFGQGTSVAQIVAAINGVSDATGVQAVNNNGELQLITTAYGSAAFVSVKVLSGDANGTFGGGLSAGRANGTDIVATVNGIEANGKGNTLSINTATLDMTMTVANGSSTDVNFTIVGGGALFQLGPDVVSNQQARIGITSVNTAKLGGVSGKLFQLGSGGSADLAKGNLNVAAQIVEEAMNQITSLRGRLGAFQRTTLETNKQALNDTLINLTEAESLIRDADFAAETAALTRAQILVQSGTVVLQITNQNPQNVLALLR